ncbi:hypothetical protein CDD83_9984 [Cordyceps sp. RAO-2017]|nr:hypothetical protein CDD83_9984 [Cordyceps sp. RAO-2017]
MAAPKGLVSRRRLSIHTGPSCLKIGQPAAAPWPRPKARAWQPRNGRSHSTTPSLASPPWRLRPPWPSPWLALSSLGSASLDLVRGPAAIAAYASHSTGQPSDHIPDRYKAIHTLQLRTGGYKATKQHLPPTKDRGLSRVDDESPFLSAPFRARFYLWPLPLPPSLPLSEPLPSWTRPRIRLARRSDQSRFRRVSWIDAPVAAPGSCLCPRRPVFALAARGHRVVAVVAVAVAVVVSGQTHRHATRCRGRTDHTHSPASCLGARTPTSCTHAHIQTTVQHLHTYTHTDSRAPSLVLPPRHEAVLLCHAPDQAHPGPSIE